MRRILAVLMAAGVALAGAGSVVLPGSGPDATRPLAAAQTLAAPPLFFVENRGQVHGDGAYYVQGRDLRLAFGAGGVEIIQYGALPGAERSRPRRPGAQVAVIDGVTRAVGPPRRPTDTVRLDFVGARADARPVGREQTPTVVSHFYGPRSEWLTGLATYREIVYGDLWPGVDLVYRAEADQVKATFVVRPGADPRAIRLAWRAADDIPAGVGFDVGAYDPTRPLVIDPAVFAYAGFFGGPDGNRGLGIAVDGAGSAYFCGETDTDRGGRDAYAVKVSADGTRYDYIAYVGGKADDTCFDIGVDPAGNAYLTGVAGSRPGDGFPVTMGPDLTHNGGVDDTLVAKLNPAGTDLVYAGYLGGTGFDFGEGIRVAPDGSVYLSGIAGSTEKSFPVVVGPDLTFNGGYDTYVCKLKPVPSAPEPKDNYDYCGYIGGDQQDVGVFRDNEGGVGITAGHVAIDATGNAYASGMTRSTEATFPDGDGFGDLPGPDRTHNGDWDAWVAKVRADGRGLVYAGYLGGSGQDEGYGAGVDAAGAFYFTGATMSGQDFPAVVGPDLTYNGGTSDAFVAKVAPDGSRYEYAGFIGGECRTDCGPDTDEMGVGLTVDAEGHAYPIGWTYGAGTSFPTVNGPDLSPNGALISLPGDDGASADAWVGRVKLDPSADAVTDNFDFLGYIGGDKWDAAFWVALDGRGGVYVAGDTASDATTFPNGDGLAPFNSPRRERAGEYDAFVAKVQFAPGPTLTPNPTPTTRPTPVARSLLPRVLRGR